MYKFLFVFALFMFMDDFCYSQNFNQNANQNVNQNSIIINNLPVIEKKEYIIKYRPVYIEKPQPRRYARKLPAPICLQGFLWVYPEDLGTYTGGPNDIISQINRQELHGRNDWRIPTENELQLMENYADKCGLGDGIYLSASHSNGILRLVSTGMSVREQREQEAAEAAEAREAELRFMQQAKEAQELRSAQWAAEYQASIDEQRRLVASGNGFLIDGIIWASTNVGSNDPYNKGVAYSSVKCPKHWRLPSESEMRALLRQSTRYENYYQHSSGLIIPFGAYAIQGTKSYIILPSMIKSSGDISKHIRLVQNMKY